MDSRQEAVVNRLPLWALFSANTISALGSTLTTIAIPWFVLLTTGSATRTGLTALVEIFANILASAFGGTLVDRFNRKWVCVLSDLASGAAVASIPLLYYTIGLAFWQLLILVFLASLFNAPGTTACTALLPDVAELANMALERASAILQAIQRGSTLVAAPLAGLLLVVLGTTRLLWVDAVSFILSACIITLALKGTIHPVQRSDEQVKEEAIPAGMTMALTDIKLSFQLLWQDRLMLAIMSTVMITNLLDAPFFAIIVPVYIKAHFGSALIFGWASAAGGGGSLLGAILFSIIGIKLPRRALFILAFISLGLPFWALALFPVLPLTLIALMIGGMAAAPINPIIMTVMMERVPAHMRGRVLAPLVGLALVMIPLGLLLVGIGIEHIGLQQVLFSVAILYLIVALRLLFNPSLRHMERRAEESPLPVLIHKQA